VVEGDVDIVLFVVSRLSSALLWHTVSLSRSRSFAVFSVWWKANG